ncbi:hypothetical protein [Botrimarina sp.]|uniref:hypothetical protein n=1 Tax=Botrimarina sp. TaxID=2795802 RepID=UPI0032EDB2B9
MKRIYNVCAALACGAWCALAGVSSDAAFFYFVGPAGGDFFDEANWNDQPDGSGSSPIGDAIPDSTTGAIAIDLVIDGDTVEAAGQVDFGPGSLTLAPGSMLSITGLDNDLDINDDSTFTLVDATLSVFDIANFEGVSVFVGGSVTSVTDDIAFQDNFANLTIQGTAFSAVDNIYFDGFNGLIRDASFVSGDRLGVRNMVDVTMTDTFLEIASGSGDIDDVFSTDGAGSVLTLLGASTLIADSVEEDALLVLGGTTVANMGGQGERITADGSTITVTSLGVVLNVSPITTDTRGQLINGLTGLSYLDDPSAWNVPDWNGLDAVSLSLIPEPAAGMLMASACVAGLAARRRHG